MTNVPTTTASPIASARRLRTPAPPPSPAWLQTALTATNNVLGESHIDIQLQIVNSLSAERFQLGRKVSTFGMEAVRSHDPYQGRDLPASCGWWGSSHFPNVSGISRRERLKHREHSILAINPFARPTRSVDVPPRLVNEIWRRCDVGILFGPEYKCFVLSLLQRQGLTVHPDSPEELVGAGARQNTASCASSTGISRPIRGAQGGQDLLFEN